MESTTFSDEVFAKAVQVMAFALQINQGGKAHAFVELSGHVNALSVRVEPADTDYQDTGRNPVIGQTVWLDGEVGGDVLAQLDAAMAYLQSRAEG